MNEIIEYIKNMRKMIGHERLLIVGSSAFVYKDGKVLLQRRKDNNCWADHGGCVEIGESVEETVKRELLEETGLIANSLDFLGVFSGEDTLYTYPNGDQVYIIMICWICDDFSGNLLPQVYEVLELKWFDIDCLPKEISPPVRKPLNSFVEHIKRRK